MRYHRLWCWRMKNLWFGFSITLFFTKILITKSLGTQLTTYMFNTSTLNFTLSLLPRFFFCTFITRYHILEAADNLEGYEICSWYSSHCYNYVCCMCVQKNLPLPFLTEHVLISTPNLVLRPNGSIRGIRVAINTWADNANAAYASHTTIGALKLPPHKNYSCR